MLKKVIEITAIPVSTLFSQDRKQALQHILDGFQSLLNQLYILSAGQNTAIELVCLSGEPSERRTHNPVRLLFVVHSEANTMQVDSLISALTSHLRTNHFLLKELEQNDSDKLTTSLMNIVSANLSAIVKSEKIVTSPLSYTGYYYFADVLSPGADKAVNNFSALLETVAHTPNSFVSFQLIPMKMQPQEEYALRDLANGLKQSVQGVFTQGEMIRETYADAPYKCYAYYSQRIGQPFFSYNITVGSLASTYPLAAQVISFLQASTGTEINIEPVDINPAQQVQFDSNLYPWQINNLLQQYYRNPDIWGGNIVAPMNLSRLPFWVTSEEAAVFFRLPIDDGSIVGIESNMIAESTEMLRESVVRDDNILFGTQKNQPSIMIGASEKAFTQHATIVGVPGTGKTTFALNLLLQFYKKDIPFLAIEPTKKEYRALLKAIPELQVFTPGNNTVSPFILNPFIPPKGVSMEQYVPSLANAFQAAFHMPEPLDVIFLNAIRTCYREHGWKDYSCYGDTDVQMFGLYEFILTFNKIVAGTDYSREVKGNIQSGGTFRLMNLIEQNSNIYDTVNTIPLEDILSCPTVIELNAIDNEEFKSLLMALIFINVCVYAKHNQTSDGELKNVLLIDEAHVLLDDAKASYQQKGGSSNATVKVLQSMVAEIRALGTSIIIADQSPRKIGKDIIDNTDIKIAFRLVGNEARDIIADCTDMDEHTKQHLSRLNTGEAFVYYRDLKSAQLLMTPDIRKQEGIAFSIADAEIVAHDNYWTEHKNLLMPYQECQYSHICKESCNFKVRSDADYYASHILSEFGMRIKDKELLIKYAYMLHELVIKYEKHNIDKSELKRLCNCTKIKFLRKAQLAKPVCKLSTKEIQKLLPDILMKKEDEKNV